MHGVVVRIRKPDGTVEAEQMIATDPNLATITHFDFGVAGTFGWRRTIEIEFDPGLVTSTGVAQHRKDAAP